MTGQFKEAESKDYGLESMIYEMDEGTPIYYRGYRQVLNGAKSPEQIMGSGILRSLVIKLIQEFLDRQFQKTTGQAIRAYIFTHRITCLPLSVATSKKYTPGAQSDAFSCREKDPLPACSNS